jgi:ATPase family AAA domain-containing protein 1
MSDPSGQSAAGGQQARRVVEFVFSELFTAGVGLVAIWLGARVLRKALDPGADQRDRARARRDQVLMRLEQTGVPRKALSNISPAEEALLYDLVFPEDISANFATIGGLDKVKEAMREIIVYPLMYPSVYGMGPDAASGSDPGSSGGAGSGGCGSTGSLLAPPKGVLLYGPPGTGKTLLASALAKESGANFLSLSPSSMLSKWLGETEQLARAVFSLARRVQPTVIFIDEVDGLFRERSSSEHEAHKNLKAEFMQLWDGLASDDHGSMVIVLGATNRPYDVDPAILRRMPRAFEVGLPTIHERSAILRKILADAALAPGFSFDKVAQMTNGYSGSDLKELCRAAMMQPVREALRATHKAAAKAARAAAADAAAATTASAFSSSATPAMSELRVPPPQAAAIRPLELDDVLQAREEVTRTEVQSRDYMYRSMMTQNAPPSS